MLTKKDLKWLRFCVAGARIFSTCARRQYFAIIVDTHGHVLSTGYNGGPRGMAHCEDGACPRLHSDTEPGIDYSNCIAIHAEANAHLHSDYTARQAAGGTLYVNGTPCYDCAKLTANSGLTRVVYIDDHPRSGSIDFMERLGIECIAVPADVLAA
jgi:dCMP deaminase